MKWGVKKDKIKYVVVAEVGFLIFFFFCFSGYVELLIVHIDFTALNWPVRSTPLGIPFLIALQFSLQEILEEKKRRKKPHKKNNNTDRTRCQLRSEGQEGPAFKKMKKQKKDTVSLRKTTLLQESD